MNMDSVIKAIIGGGIKSGSRLESLGNLSFPSGIGRGSWTRVGFDALYFGRIDYQDREKRKQLKNLEVVWRGSKSLGSSSDVFTGIFPKNYEPPPGGFYFEINDKYPVIQDDPLLFDYNVQERVDDFVAAAVSQANISRANHIMFTMGTDFKYQYANSWFKEMDKFIHYVNQDVDVSMSPCIRRASFFKHLLHCVGLELMHIFVAFLLGDMLAHWSPAPPILVARPPDLDAAHPAVSLTDALPSPCCIYPLLPCRTFHLLQILATARRNPLLLLH
ncbi:hypothetical protein KSP40_PGU007504 [Platanthera guangdongensis]|uniref:Glycoside hydrolase family 38 N-terminal domain-containing protein n=1 Tax=Platanthera guangdongensis TaxID=2320717 RepID=A0ABR2N176_9ASPA